MLLRFWTPKRVHLSAGSDPVRQTAVVLSVPVQRSVGTDGHHKAERPPVLLSLYMISSSRRKVFDSVDVLRFVAFMNHQHQIHLLFHLEENKKR